MHSPVWPVRLAVIVLLAVSVVLLWLLLRQLGMPASLSATEISIWLGEQGVFGPLLLIALMIMAVVVGPIPTLPISAASGLAFGVVGGTLVAAGGALIGAMIAFFAARLAGRDLICRYLEGNPLITGKHSQPALFWIVFVTRLVPLFSFALISYAAGITAISPGRFALATFFGMLPMTVVFAGLGHTFEFHPALTVIAAVFIITAMMFVPYYLHRHHRKRLERWLGMDS